MAESVSFEAREIILYHAFMHEISLRDLELYTEVLNDLFNRELS
jgi:hypothetical protein